MRRQIPQHRGQRSPLLSRNSRFIEPIEEEEPEPEPIESSDDDEDEIHHHEHIRFGLLFLQGNNPQESDSRVSSTTWSQQYDYNSMEGLVDAVITSILHGQRAIFYDIITGPGIRTITLPEACQCYVSDRLAIPALTSDDLGGNFPLYTGHYRVTRTKPKDGCLLEFDGILRYPLLFMTVIARSAHRDISLAYDNHPFPQRV